MALWERGCGLSKPPGFFITTNLLQTMKAQRIVLLCLLAATFWTCHNQKNQETDIVEKSEKVVEHGKYLVEVLGCTDCHTPKKMTAQGPIHDTGKYLMGFDASQSLPPVPENVPIGPWVLFSGDLTAAVGPWGTSYAGNLTPHETGIGNWNLEQFKKVLREAKYKGLDNSRPIMPPMPKHYSYLTDDDIAAIFEYLKTIKPIDNVVPSYRPPSS